MAEEKHFLGLSIRWRLTGWIALMTAAIMFIVVVIVRDQISRTLRGQVETRALSLARNLASSATEPLSFVSKEAEAKTDAQKEMVEKMRMLLWSMPGGYVQSGGGEEGRRMLTERPAFMGQVAAAMLGFFKGAEAPAEAVRNEGVLYTAVVDAAGNVVCYADAVVPADVEKFGKPFEPWQGTSVLLPDFPQQVWESPARSGVLMVGIPMVPGGSGQEGASAPGAQGAQAPSRSGVVYLAISESVIERTVAKAVGQLVMAALGLIIVGALFALLVSYFMTRPIQLLQRAVRAIAGGDFNQRIQLGQALKDELAELTDAFNEMAKGLAERELMRGAFSAYVSKDLLAEIIKNPDALKVGGARRQATVMFTFFGSHDQLAALSERLPAEDLVRIINGYLELQALRVNEHKGYLDKFVGDEVMAVWGVPLDHPEHALGAVRCAFDIQRAVGRFNEERAKKGLMTTEISIGINTGPLIAGNMGSAGAKLDYTVIGGTVNFAARLGGYRLHGGSVWLSESTYAEVKDRVEVKDIGKVEFKGLEQPQQVYELVGIRETVPAKG
jgi:class 3 adenylate cyclase